VKSFKIREIIVFNKAELMRKTNTNKLTAVAGLIIVFGLMGISHVSAQTVWLDQLDLSTATQGRSEEHTSEL